MNPPQFPPPQRSADDEHLRLLVIFHYVVAGLGVLGLLFVVAHAATVLVVFRHGDEPPALPVEMRGFVIGIYAFSVLLIVGGSILNFLSAQWMKNRKNRMFSLVVAGLNCLQIPLGLALGIFTFIVLGRPSVVAAYEAQAR